MPRGYNGTVASPDADMWCLRPDNATGEVRMVDAYQADQCYVMRMYWAWSLYMMISVPQLLVAIRCLWYVVFKKKKKPTWRIRLVVLLVETVYSIGLCLLVFVVLPSLDNSLLALVAMLGVGLVPGALKLLVRPEHEQRRPLNVTLDCAAIVVQLSMLVVWPLAVAASDAESLYDRTLIWSLPTALLCVSVRWWENYVDRDSRFGRIRKWMNRLAGDIRRTRTKTQLMASVWKMGLNVVLMMLFVGMQLDDAGLSWNERMTAVFHFDVRSAK